MTHYSKFMFRVTLKGPPICYHGLLDETESSIIDKFLKEIAWVIIIKTLHMQPIKPY